MNNFPDDKESVGQDTSSEKSAASEIQGAESTGSNQTSGDVISPKPRLIRRIFLSIWNSLVLRRVVFKVLTLVYALAVFGYAYFQMSAHRNILSYMGVMLLMVVVYAEILVIRDHLWVIEGSMRESRRWRDVFFNQTSLRRQRVRKFFSILFSLGIFSYMYLQAGSQHKSVLSFMGIMLMMTVLYYEILTIRDEIFVIGQSISPCSDEESDKRKQHYDKFIEQAKDDAADNESKSSAMQGKPAESVKKDAVAVEPIAAAPEKKD